MQVTLLPCARGPRRGGPRPRSASGPAPELRVGRRLLAAGVGAWLSCSLGCDAPPAPAPEPQASTAGVTASAAAPPASALAEPTAVAPAKRPMPPRPVPLGSSGPIQPSAPPEQQMMAIQYTLAMVSPQPTDPLIDKAYIEAILPKLAAAVRTADKGKTPPDPVRTAKGSRKIEVEMGRGCTERVPSNLLAQRAGSSLRDAYNAGVLVISCHDDKWECHQATRDPEDVLCHAAPRR